MLDKAKFHFNSQSPNRYRTRGFWFSSLVICQIAVTVFYLISHLLLELDYLFAGKGIVSNVHAVSLIKYEDVKVISIALLTASVSLFVLAPLLVTQAKSHLQQIQLTSIEARVIEGSDLIPWIGLSSFLAVVVSVATLAKTTYVGLIMQFAFIAFASIQVIWEMLALSYTSRKTKEKFAEEVADWFKEKLSQLFKQEKAYKEQSKSLRENVARIAKHYVTMTVRIVNYPSSEVAVSIRRNSQMRINRLKLKPALDYLSRIVDSATDADSSEIEVKNVEVRIIDPYLSWAFRQTKVPLVSINNFPGTISESQYQDLIGAMEELIRKNLTWEHDHAEDFAQDFEIILEELSDALSNADHQRAQRQFQIVEKIVATLYSDDELPSEQTKRKVHWLLRNYSIPISDTADSYLVKRSVRRSVLDHIRRLISVSVDNEDVTTFSQLSQLYRTIIFGYTDSASSNRQLSGKVRTLEIEHLALFTHELSYKYKRQVFESNSWNISYIIEQRKVFEQTLNCWLRDGDVKDALENIVRLARRFYRSTDKRDPGAKLGALLQASCEAYFLYQAFHKGKAEPLTELVDVIFRKELRSNLASVLSDSILTGRLEDFQWSEWPVQDNLFDRGYTFSSTDWMLRVIGLRFMLQGDISWAMGLDAHRLRRLIQLLDEDYEIWDLYTENARIGREGAKDRIGEQIERIETEKERSLENAELDYCTIERFIAKVGADLNQSIYSHVFSEIAVTSEEPVGRSDVLSITMPKSLFIVGSSEELPDTRFAKDIWGALLAFMISDAKERKFIHEGDDVLSLRERRSEYVIFENRIQSENESRTDEFMDIITSGGSEVKSMRVWFNSLDAGIYILDKNKLGVSVSRNEGEEVILESMVVAPWFKVEITTEGTKLRMRFVLQGRFEFEEGVILVAN